MRKLLLFVVLMAACAINVRSQEFTSTNRNSFFSYISQQDNYYNNLIEQNGGSSDGINGYKAYNRWKSKYIEQAYNDDGMQNVLNAEHFFNRNYNAIMASSDGIQIEWEDMGPQNKPNNRLYAGTSYISVGGVGRIFFIEFDPQNINRVFVGSPTGGLFFSSDHGETWINGGTDFLPSPGISHFKLIPQSGTNAETWFILTGDMDNSWSFTHGIYRSTNQGLSWEDVSSGLNLNGYTTGRKIIVNESNPNIMFVNLSNGLYKTTNALSANVTWAKIIDSDFSDEYFTDICYKPNSNYQTIYAATRDSIFRSTDGGISFSALPNLNENMFLGESAEERRITIRTTPANSHILYSVFITEQGGSKSVIYKFNDLTNQWTQMGVMLPDYNNQEEAIGFGRYQAFAVSPTDENVLYKSRINYVSKSVNGGLTWQKLSADKHDDTHWICFENNSSNRIWLGTDGGVYYTENDFVDIIDKTYGIGVANIEKVSAATKDADLIIIGSFDCGVSLYESDISEWGVFMGGDGYKGLINDADLGNITYHASASDAIPRKFHDSLYAKGIPWWDIGDTSIAPNGFYHSMNNDYYNNNIIFYPGHYRIGRSLDNADTWEAISPMANDTSIWVRYGKIENTKYNPNILYVTKIRNNFAGNYPQDFQLLKSTNCLANASNVAWQDITPVFNGVIYRGWCGDIAINGNDINEIWATYGSYNTDKKILHYKNGLWSNITDDPNNTLEHLSITQVEWVNGTDNMLIIGTNCGVYYKTDNMANWTKLEGMPNVRVKEIVLQPETNKFLVATYGRGLWRGNIPCDVAGGDITITTNTTWNTNQIIPNNLIIEAGATLTINNSEVSFAGQKKLIIKQNAKLILNNTTLDSRCTEKWAGVEVWGNKLQTQTDQYQGKLMMYNSTIANAHEAVQLWKPGDYNKTGGIIYAENSTFLNNRRAISILSYRNINPSFGIEYDYVATFKQCQFVNNGNYFADNPFYSFVSLWDVRGVKFRACTFDAGDFSQSAIYAIDAGFKVESICNGAIGPNGCLPQDLERCEFYNFDKAISAQNTLMADLYPINIQHAYFYNNNYGGWFNGLVNVLTVKTSEFVIGKHGENKEKLICGSFFGRGIHIQGSTGFFIENNAFSPIPNSNYADDIIGIVAMVNPSNHDIIFKNTFSNLFIGNEAFGDNRRGDGLFGIEYQCNQNSANRIDFEVIGDPDEAQINPSIGYVNLSARNTFSSDRVLWHWRNMGSETEHYYLHASEHETNYEPDSLKIETYLPNTFDKSWATTLNECSDDIGIHTERLILTPQEKQELETEFVIANNEYNSVETIYDNLKDGGSTVATSISIETAEPADTWELRSNLLGMSPFLSRNVLELAANRTDVLPNSVLLDILAANPDELKKNDFISFLENKEEPLPNYMIDILRDLSAGTTYKTALLNQMAIQKRKQVVAAKKIVNSLINEDEQNLVAIKSWLGSMKSLTADLQIASLLISEGNYNNANAFLELLPDLYNLEGDALELYLDDKFLLTLKATLKQQDRNMTQLNSTELTQLETIADNPTGMSRNSARTILESYYGYNEFCDCLDRNGDKNAFVNRNDASAKTDSPLSISASPNPAKHYVEFYYELSELDNEGIILISDINGKSIQAFKIRNNKGIQAWDTRSIPAGSYVYTLKTKYFEKSGKLIIQ